MEEITLQALLEAGCHFGHKSERWHPKAAPFIYTKKDGIHIIDLAKTKAGLDAAVAYIMNVAARGGEVLFVATKRQAKGVVKEEAVGAGAPYLVERWIGGFLTNWDQIHKNIQKIIRLSDEQVSGAWKKFPKHEQVKLGRYLARLKIFYGGVLTLTVPPEAVFIVDVKKENVAVREAVRTEKPIVAIVDTNSNPEDISFAIPANDDAVGSVQLITRVIARAYKEGKEKREKETAALEGKQRPDAITPQSSEVPKSDVPQQKDTGKQAIKTDAPKQTVRAKKKA